MTSHNVKEVGKRWLVSAIVIRLSLVGRPNADVHLVDISQGEGYWTFCLVSFPKALKETRSIKSHSGLMEQAYKRHLGNGIAVS